MLPLINMDVYEGEEISRISMNQNISTTYSIWFVVDNNDNKRVLQRKFIIESSILSNIYALGHY